MAIGGQVDFKVTPEILNAKAGEVTTDIDKMTNDFEAAASIVARTKYYWIGEAGELHRKIYEDQKEDIADVLRRWREHPRDLQMIAQTYTAAEREVSAIAGSLPNDVIV